MMAKMYQIRPSELMGIDNDYEAFCFDEVAMVLLNKAMDDEGNIKWNRIRWKDKERNNKSFMEFVKGRD